MKKLLLLCLLIISTQSFALKITSYDTYLEDWHQVTVAFDDLEKRGSVECVIKMNGEPVGKDWNFIEGVGVVEIRLNPNFAKRKTTASCSIKK
jgi:hypothetical protein